MPGASKNKEKSTVLLNIDQLQTSPAIGPNAAAPSLNDA